MKNHTFSQVVDIFMFRIISGAYKPGESLPSIQNMAAKNEISQDVMRRVVIELSKRGVVERKKHGRGSHITTNMEYLERLKNREAHQMTEIFYDKMILLGYSEEEIKKEIETAAMQGKE